MKEQQPVIKAIEADLLKSELTKDKFIRHTNFGNNEVYIVNAHNAPNVMKEIGRLRELSFRQGGGGTGKEADIDSYDTAEQPYQQLIVWNPKDREITGGYRFIILKNIPKDENGNIKLATTKLFHLSAKFIQEYIPYTLELGRSFVTPRYQSSSSQRKSIFALDNLWNGLGAVVYNNPDIKYLFGKVTMYTSYNQTARDLLLYFMATQFPDNDKLVYPIKPLGYKTPVETLKKNLNKDTYAENYKILSQKVRELGENIPPLINTYMNLSPTMKTFGTAMNYNFGEVEETGILVTINDIYERKKERHIVSYLKELGKHKNK